MGDLVKYRTLLFLLLAVDLKMVLVVMLQISLGRMMQLVLDRNVDVFCWLQFVALMLKMLNFDGCLWDSKNSGKIQHAIVGDLSCFRVRAMLVSRYFVCSSHYDFGVFECSLNQANFYSVYRSRPVLMSSWFLCISAFMILRKNLFHRNVLVSIIYLNYLSSLILLG